MKVKVVLLGDAAVGKTSLVRRFVLDQFGDEYLATIGTKVTKKDIIVPNAGQGMLLVMTVWDVLGQKGYAGVQESAAKGAQAVLLVCDVTRDESWKSFEEYWIPLVWRLAGKVPIVFAGNKVDLAEDRSAARDILAYLEQKYEGKAFLTSAKTGENVDAIFQELGRRVIRTLNESIERVADPTPPPQAIAPALRVTDGIMTDFCAGFGGLESAMHVVRQQFEKAGVDVRAPTKDGLLKVVDLLADVEKVTKMPDTVALNRLRRISWIRALD